jgi:peptide methionine sulfoxide reductase MsrA
MAAASGVVRTRVGYCGGKTPDPTYRKVNIILSPGNDYYKPFCISAE